MAKIIDVSHRVGAQARALAAAGVQTVFRYYTRDSVVNAEKRLHLDEALQLAGAGLRIGAVYEGRRGNQIDNFSRDAGLKDATFARTYANHAIGQPAGSAIYFAVDTDEATAKKVDQLIIPYFESVAQAMADANGEPHYAVGVYGNGAVCSALLDRGLVTKTWVAQATKWRGSQAFRASGRWTLDQGPSGVVGGVSCDPDNAAPGAEIGDFMLRPAQPRPPAGKSAGG